LGTISSVLQLLKLPDGTVKVLVEGTERGLVKRYHFEDEFLHAHCTGLSSHFDEGREAEILIRAVISQFEQYVKMNKRIPPEILTALAGIEEPGRLADTIAAHLTLKIGEKQEVLELTNINQRMEKLLALMETEIDMMQVENRIRGRVKRLSKKN
jgi:ATP-dependent Lon protease